VNAFARGWAGGLAGIVLLLQAASAATLEDGRDAVRQRRFSEALDILSPLAAQGDAEAALELGGLYDLGEGVAEDPAAALRWYRQAAEHGLPAAELDVALMYDTGRGTPRDAGKAALWYARAAARGDLRAAYDLGQLYEAGDGVPRNDDFAAAWFRQAAAGGLQAASQHLADLARHHQAPAPANSPTPGPTLLAPDENAVVPVEAKTPDVVLVWTLPAQPNPAKIFVEAVALGQPAAEPILQAYAQTSAVLLKLPEAGGRYLWRVYVVSVDRRSYAATPWRRFSVAPVGALQAAR